MWSRKSLERIIADLKKNDKDTLALQKCTIAITSPCFMDIESAFVELPCLLDPIWLNNQCERLFSFVNSLDTLVNNLNTGKKDLAREIDKEFIKTLQISMINYAVHDLLEGYLTVKHSIKCEFSILNHNISPSTLVYAVTRNMLSHLIVALYAHEGIDQLDPDYCLATINALGDSKQLEKLVWEALNQRFFAKVNNNRKTFLELIEADKATNKAATNYIEYGKEKSQSNDVSRLFDLYPCLLDKKVVKHLAEEYKDYVEAIKLANLTLEEGPINLSPFCEDFQWLMSFEKHIIQLGIQDLIGTAGEIRPEVKRCIGIGSSVLTAQQLLSGYLSAVIQTIMVHAFPTVLNEDQKRKMAALSVVHRDYCISWIKEELLAYPTISLTSNIYSPKTDQARLPDYYLGIGTKEVISMVTIGLMGLGFGLFTATRKAQQDNFCELKEINNAVVRPLLKSNEKS